MDSNITMSVAKDGTITWNPPRLTEPFMIKLFGCVDEKLFGVDGDGAELAYADGEDKTIHVEAGENNIFGGQIVGGVTYVNLIEVKSDGSIVEKRNMVSDARKTLDRFDRMLKAQTN